jgi:hypothetical protein
LYSALVIEPTNSKWTFLDGTPMGGADASGAPAALRRDGGPTSYAANVIVHKNGVPCIDLKNSDPRCSEQNDNEGTVDKGRTAREFNLAFADFAIVYDKNNRPINPPNRLDRDLPSPSIAGPIPAPEAISASDPGTQLINYRNEPIPLRVGELDKSGNQYRQKAGAEGDMANVFSSKVHVNQGDKGTFLFSKDKPAKGELFTESLLKGLRNPGDPATPLLMAYAGDRVQVRLIQGAQEENHTFNMHGVKWLAQPASPNSGFMNGQPIGISEHFEFDVTVDTVDPKRDADYLYSSWATDNLWDGQWGILRSFGWGSQKAGLKRLPSNALQTGDLPRAPSVCPIEAPKRKITVVAGFAKELFGAPVIYNRGAKMQDDFAIVFKRTQESYNETPLQTPNNFTMVCDDNAGKQCSNSGNPEPLILRARANDCIEVTLVNKLPKSAEQMPDTPRVCNDPNGCNDPKNPEHQAYKAYSRTWSFNTLPPITPGLNFNQIASSNRVSLHPQLLAVNVFDGDGSNVGLNRYSTAMAGAEIVALPRAGDPVPINYHWYAGNIKLVNNRPVEDPVEFGIVGLRDMGDVIKHSSHGAIGALVVEPQCSSWVEDGNTKASATIEHWTPSKNAEGRTVPRIRVAVSG